MDYVPNFLEKETLNKATFIMETIRRKMRCLEDQMIKPQIITLDKETYLFLRHYIDFQYKTFKPVIPWIDDVEKVRYDKLFGLSLFVCNSENEIISVGI